MKTPLYLITDLGHETPCWIFNRRSRSQGGYGMIRVDSVLYMAHRVFYERAHGKIADGLTLDHLCRNRACVNPDHLEPVSQATNVQRGSIAKLTPELVQEIRATTESARSIARRIGVTHTAVAAARRGVSWRNVA